MSHILNIAGRRAAVCHVRLPGLWRVCLRNLNGGGAATTATAAEQHTPQETARPFEEIPGPKGLPFIGTSLEYTPFGRFPIETKIANSTIERYKTYGKIYREKFGPREMVFVCDPKDFETVFRSEGRFPDRPVPESIATWRRLRKKPLGLSTLMGEEWFRYRSSVNKSMMRPKSVGAYATMQDDVSRDLVGLMQAIVQGEQSDSQVSNFTNTCYKWSLEAMSLVVLGKRLGCLTQDQLAEDSDAYRMITAVSDFFVPFGKLETSVPLYKYISTPTWKKFERAADTISSVSETIIGEKLAELRKMEHPPEETDFLANLLSNKNMTLPEVIIMAIELLTGAIDTTAHTLVFNLFCLAKNPRAQQKLYEEIMEVVPPGRPVDDKMLNKMHYLRAVVKETFSVTSQQRWIAHSLTKIGADQSKIWTTVLMAQNVISTLPEYYPDPEAYLPERWLRAESADIAPFSLLPFGYGPRMCIGRRFAEQEVYLGLARIIQTFHVGWEGEDMKQVWRIVNAPDRDSFVFRER